MFFMGGRRYQYGAFPPRPDAIHNPYDFSFDVNTQQALGCSKPGHQTLDCWFNQAAFVVPALSSCQATAEPSVLHAIRQCQARRVARSRHGQL